VGPRCSFCGLVSGPFQEVGGTFPLLMCTGCQAARSASGTRGLLEPPSELLADYDPGQPELQWTCALCGYRCFVPTWLEDHTDGEHPGWVARFEVVRPYPRQVLRVVYRRAADQGSGEG
jgi:hypothetical protein